MEPSEIYSMALSSENPSSSRTFPDSFQDGKNPSSSEDMPLEINTERQISLSTNLELSRLFSGEMTEASKRWKSTNSKEREELV